jgi:ABC-type uncharacterized transport system substrate-binding protein
VFQDFLQDALIVQFGLAVRDRARRHQIFNGGRATKRELAGMDLLHSLARPGGNATRFSVFEYGIGSKCLELLKEIAPNVTRVAVLRDPSFAAGIGLLAAMQAVAPSLGMELTPIDANLMRLNVALQNLRVQQRAA